MKNGPKNSVLVCLLLLLALASSCYKGEKAFHPAAKSLRDIPYARGIPGDELLKLDIHTPKDGGKNLPVIVYIHGGGWTSSDKSEMDQWCRRIADRGYLVINVNYRLAPEFPFPTAVNDCLGAMCWIVRHAAEYGGDISRMGITGGSAGGHLAAMVAGAWNDPHFSPTGCEDKNFSLKIKAQVPFFGVFDFEHPGVMKLTHIPQKFLGPKKEKPENYKLASPINYITSPPTLIVVGRLDPIYSQSKIYYHALKKAGVPVQIKVYPLETHGFDFQFWKKASKDAFERMMAFFDQYLKS